MAARLRETVILAVAGRWGCAYEELHHRPLAMRLGVDAATIDALLTGTPWIETLPLADADYTMTASIAVSGEVDKLVFALVAGTDYRFDMLGVSTLAAGWLGDPALRLLAEGGTLAGANDDSGAGFDAALAFRPAGSGTYTLEMSAVGGLTGAYQLQASVVGGAAMLSGQTYVVSNAATIVLEERTGALTLPATAVVRDGTQTLCCVVQGGKIVRRPLQLGIRAGEDVEVLSGLEPTESVVLLRADALQEGQAVEVIEPEKK